MRLLLIRHAETVDNVAGVYAGSRDSPLTAHGAIQARRLGTHLAARSSASTAARSTTSGGSSGPDGSRGSRRDAGIGPVTHIFTSDLARAVETAKAILHALTPSDSPQIAGSAPVADGPVPPPAVVRLVELRERHFGAAEGKLFAELGDAGLALVDGVESREDVRTRAERFALRWLVPALVGGPGSGCPAPPDVGRCVVVVAHGLILDALLGVLLARFGRPGETSRLRELGRTTWGNTGYAELAVEVRAAVASLFEDECTPASGERAPSQQQPPPPDEPPIAMSVVDVNVLKHLEGLKRTRGGIGSARLDKRQRTVDSFFGPTAKRRKDKA